MIDVIDEVLGNVRVSFVFKWVGSLWYTNRTIDQCSPTSTASTASAAGLLFALCALHLGCWSGIGTGWKAEVWS